jgi:hypothetical protein
MGGGNKAEGRSEAVFEELERQLCRLPDVEVVRVVGAESGAVREVHVVARPRKAPKHVVRDVQAVALATFGIEIDHRVVSVAQVDLGDDAAGESSGAASARPAPAPGRARYTGLHVHAEGRETIVTVALDRDGVDVTGTAVGAAATSTRLRLVAQATIDALRRLDEHDEVFDVASALVTSVGSAPVAVVTVARVSPAGEELMAGSAIVRAGGESEAVVRATLDATNRRLARTERT